MMKNVVNLLEKKNQHIATMESCTGGLIASTITDVEGAGEVLSFSAVTYSNDYKIKMGVKKETIEKYSVYSEEVAKEMSKSISVFANSDFGIGVTGKINRKDKNNQEGKDNEIFFSIYEREKDIYYTFKIESEKDKTRHKNKEEVVKRITEELTRILMKSEK